MSKYIPFPAHCKFAPLDISYLFQAEKPAGKHGFLQVQGDRFAFEDGTPVRFWGTNLNGAACFPDHTYAEQLAKRLAAYGCNMVRFHQLDAEWATPNIFQFTKGKRLSDTRHLDPDSLERLDYFIFCLKKEGIYIYLDMLTYRKFKEEDGVRNSVALPNCGTPYCIFDRRLIELQKEYFSNLWNHFNPYTQLAYKDDPVFALSEPTNEVDLFGTFGRKITAEPYASEFREMYRNWCIRRNIPIDADTADINDTTDQTLNEFKMEVQSDYFNEMFSYLRQIGIKIPLTGINFSWSYLSCKSAQGLGDYMDSHLNERWMYWEPGIKKFNNISLHERMEWGPLRNVRMRQFGKPFFTSEWDLTWPNCYRAESPIMMAAVGMLQNWSGFTIHTYAYTSLLNHMDILGKETSSESIGGVGYREGPFSTWNDPAKFGMFYHAAIITRRGDVSPANNKITVAVEELNHDLNIEKTCSEGSDKAALTASAELSQIAVDYRGECPDAIPETTPLVDLKLGEVTSDTGELYRSWNKKYGTIDTPMTKVAYGALANNGTIRLDGMKITVHNPFAVVALSSLNNELDITHSDSLLLTTMGDAVNTAMKVSPTPDSPTQKYKLQLDDVGTAPILCEVIECKIAIKTDRRNLVVWSVSAEGLFVGNVPVTYEDGWMKFTLGEKFPSPYYLIQAE